MMRIRVLLLVALVSAMAAPARADVTGFVGTTTRPSPLQDDEVKKILKKIGQEPPKVKVSFAKGERVKVVDGPFTDFIGVVDDINPEKGKVRVLVSFFGRETPVELDFLQVQRIV